MNYKEALSFIEYTNKLGSVLGLDSISRLLEHLGNPEKDLIFIHIGGTNGKGSTASFISNILRAGKYKIGLFTSPHMVKFNESIIVNGEEISDQDFGRNIGILKEAIDKILEKGYSHPTTFEIITAMSFLYYREKKVDYVVLEVGLGGKNDSTNIIPPPLASIFTTIDYDHLDILGNTIEEIATVKSGIIKENSIVVSYPQKEEVLNVLESVAKENNSEFYLCNIDNIRNIKTRENGSVFDFIFKDIELNNLEIEMVGEYQVYNAALALTTVLILKENNLLNISQDEIKEGLLATKWAGRLEVLNHKPTILVDGAHNLQGMIQLKKALGVFKYEKLILCMGVLKDKDYPHMVEEIAGLADMVVAIEVDNPRKLEAEDLGKEVSKYNENVFIEKDVEKAVELAIKKAGEKDLIVFCGSLYLIGQIREKIKLLY